MDKLETMPEIQVHSMVNLNPFFLRGMRSEQDQESTRKSSLSPISDLDIQSAITDDIVQIYHGIQHCFELRRKYIRTSLQRDYDNPKNNVDHWKIYPESPKPRVTEYNAWQDNKHDLLNVAVGEDFKMSDFQIPGPSNETHRLEVGVYQVYDQTCMVVRFTPNK